MKFRGPSSIIALAWLTGSAIAARAGHLFLWRPDLYRLSDRDIPDSQLE
jgi:hypothetical protein